MDVGTSLVEAYLRIKGYFTVTDYPLVETVRARAPRMVTATAVPAVRFLDNYLRTEHAVLGTMDLHDPALSWLSLLHKCDLTLQPESPAP